MKRKQPKNKDRKSRKSIGIIAEDQSDVDVLTVLIGKIAKRPFSVRRIVGGGCGKIVGKCRAWAQNLQAQGCRYLLVVHDLDTRNIGDLRNQLEAALRPCPIGQHLIVIPVREIEAWLLADHIAVTKAMRLRQNLKQVAHPESIQRPKEYLAHLIYMRSDRRRQYVNAVDNGKIAELCAIQRLRRCTSFVPFSDFVGGHI